MKLRLMAAPIVSAMCYQSSDGRMIISRSMAISVGRSDLPCDTVDVRNAIEANKAIADYIAKLPADRPLQVMASQVKKSRAWPGFKEWDKSPASRPTINCEALDNAARANFERNKDKPQHLRSGSADAKDLRKA